MRRVVVTGLGVISSLGNDLDAVAASLRDGRSGIRPVAEYAEQGLRSQVAGIPDLSSEPPIDRRLRRFMGDAAVYAYHAMRRAVADAGLEAAQIATPEVGVVVGSGVGSPYEHLQAIDRFREGGLSRVAPYVVPQFMGNTASACLSTAFGTQGVSFGAVSACATSAHCIGQGAELIRGGRQAMVFVGGAEEVRWTTAVLFDAMGALSTAFNNASASRPFAADRDGFVIAGGAGNLVLEELEHARQRGARVYAELVGYGAACDGQDMVSPSSDGAVRTMRQALDEAQTEIDYINAHATSTVVGDLSELDAIRRVFGASCPIISSTKGLSGHSIGAAAAQEAIYSLLMMERGFVAGNAHITQLDARAEGLPLPRVSEDRRITSFLSNSFGFGGTNASLVFRRLV